MQQNSQPVHEAVPTGTAESQAAIRKTRDVAGILHLLTPQQMAEEIVRLDAALAQARKDAHEAEREFQREARSIAAEARWEAQEETRGGCY